jgi:hypothetical protein
VGTFGAGIDSSSNACAFFYSEFYVEPISKLPKNHIVVMIVIPARDWPVSRGRDVTLSTGLRTVLYAMTVTVF